MAKKQRIKRKIVKWQTNDQGANPLTARGRKWIKKEITKVKKNFSKIRESLENQPLLKDIDSPYWKHIENSGHFNEDLLANPDLLGDNLNDTVDGDYYYEY